MNVVFDASYLNEIALHGSYGSANVFVEPFLNRFPDQGLSMLRAEDKVIDEFAVSAHLLSPLRGLDCIAYMMPWAHAHGYMLMPFHGTGREATKSSLAGAL